MGAHLVGEVLVLWAPHLSDNAFRVLVRMAHTALDNDRGSQPAGLYFGGEDLLIATLGKPRQRRDGAGRTHKSAAELTRRAVAELIELGAIERTKRGHPGSHAEFRLTLDRWPTGVATGDSGVGRQVTPEWLAGDSGVGDVHSGVGPRNHRNQEERSEEGRGCAADATTDRAGARASRLTARLAREGDQPDPMFDVTEAGVVERAS